MSAVWADRDAARVPPGLRGGTAGDDREMFPRVVECHVQFERHVGFAADEGVRPGAGRAARPAGAGLVTRSAAGGEAVVIDFVRRPPGKGRVGG
jgi:hypothetical protein